MKRALAAFLPIFLLAGAAHADRPAVLFVLDASGSMWGKVEGKSKVEVARAVMGNALRALPADVEIGLVAYGHNRKDDCGDIEVVASLGSGGEAVAKAVNALNPKGQTPLTDALRFAANQLKEREGAASVVLVSDGKETCGGDPCIAAREATAAGVHLRIHVVGFDVTTEEAEQLRCIAREGKGRYFAAKNASELTTALAEVEKEVAAPPPPPPAPTAPPPPPVSAEVPTRELVLAPGAVKLSARLGPETPVLTRQNPGMWELRTMPAGLEERGDHVDTWHDAQPVVTVKEGVYRLEVSVGNAKRIVALKVQPGAPERGEVILGAGQVKLAGRFAEGSPVLSQGLPGMWEIFEAGGGFEEERGQHVAMHHEAQPVVTLNEGSYQLVLKVGSATRSVPLGVRTGGHETIDVVLGAGQVKLSARLAAETPVLNKGEPGMWEVFEASGGFEEERGRHVTMHHDAQPIVTLNAGSYRVRAKVGEASREADLALAAGEQKRLEVVVGAGQLKLVARKGAGGPPLTEGKPGMWTIYRKGDFDERGDHVATRHEAQPIVTLNEGDYQVALDAGGTERVVAVSVAPGDKRVVEVDLSAE